jgi:site-specific DNA-methyltransferase (adenine-specific)
VAEPYYSDELVTIYHGDCRELLPSIEADVIVTDPPYGTDDWGGYGRRQLGLHTIANDSDASVRDAVLALWGDRPVLVFGSPRAPAPNGCWDVLVWDKQRPGLGSPWRWQHELIFVRGGWSNKPGIPSVLRHTPLDNPAHVHEKPTLLMRRLMTGAPPGTILDPFMGSGTTLVAAKSLNRHAIGIEIEERYCEIAAERCSQEVLGLK